MTFEWIFPGHDFVICISHVENIGSLNYANFFQILTHFIVLWWLSCLVVSNSCGPMDCSPPKLLCPWDFRGRNTGVGSHFLLQGIFLAQKSNPHLLCCRQSLALQADSLLTEPPGKAISLFNKTQITFVSIIINLRICFKYKKCQACGDGCKFSKILNFLWKLEFYHWQAILSVLSFP